jgi:hypothetical protein
MVPRYQQGTPQGEVPAPRATVLTQAATRAMMTRRGRAITACIDQGHFFKKTFHYW